MSRVPQKESFQGRVHGNSCHFCHLPLKDEQLWFCRNTKNTGRNCRKKYCEVCLGRKFGEYLNQDQRYIWKCPSCADECGCATCRKCDHDNVKKQCEVEGCVHHPDYQKRRSNNTTPRQSNKERSSPYSREARQAPPIPQQGPGKVRRRSAPTIDPADLGRLRSSHAAALQRGHARVRSDEFHAGGRMPPLESWATGQGQYSTGLESLAEQASLAEPSTPSSTSTSARSSSQNSPKLVARCFSDQHLSSSASGDLGRQLAPPSRTNLRQSESHPNFSGLLDQSGEDSLANPISVRFGGYDHSERLRVERPLQSNGAYQLEMVAEHPGERSIRMTDSDDPAERALTHRAYRGNRRASLGDFPFSSSSSSSASSSLPSSANPSASTPSAYETGRLRHAFFTPEAQAKRTLRGINDMYLAYHHANAQATRGHASELRVGGAESFTHSSTSSTPRDQLPDYNVMSHNDLQARHDRRGSVDTITNRLSLCGFDPVPKLPEVADGATSFFSEPGTDMPPLESPSAERHRRAGRASTGTTISTSDLSHHADFSLSSPSQSLAPKLNSSDFNFDFNYSGTFTV